MTDPCAVEWCDRPVGDGHIGELSVRPETMSEAGRCVNTIRPLTHSLDSTKEGLAMQATQCTIDGCTKTPRVRGWCSMHYWRWQHHGDPNWEPTRLTECTVDDCTAPPINRGLCSKHRARLERTGSTDLLPRTVDYAARFWAKVDRRGPDECWLWNGTILSSGYGQFWCPPRKRLAHRFAYELAIGPIPDGLTLDHVKARGCTHLNCVNPAHLEPVTQLENLRRSTAASAVNSRKTECPRCGNAYDTDANGQRFCRPCRNSWKTRRAE